MVVEVEEEEVQREVAAPLPSRTTAVTRGTAEPCELSGQNDDTWTGTRRSLSSPGLGIDGMSSDRAAERREVAEVVDHRAAARVAAPACRRRRRRVTAARLAAGPEPALGSWL